MRSRNIKPGFFKNEYLAECDPLARILFAGLWCMADREGRLEYRLKRLKAELLPYDDCNIEHLIDQLLERSFISLYEVDGQYYILIPTFTEHQHCNIKEQASTIPAPDEHGASTVQTRPLTPYPIPHTENPIPHTSGCAKKHHVNPSPGNGSFARFWEAYPKKKSRGVAEKAFMKIKPDEQLLASMIAKIEQAKKSVDWMKDGGRYIPYPATWLHARGWEDEGTEVHPMADKVSETTIHNINVLNDWRPPDDRRN